LRSLVAERGAAFPDIRVATRTGDTSQAERRRMVSRPPSILVTTPESLCLILDSPKARQVLAELRLLILDEVHALSDSKRGSLLACAVGRLALLAGEFQRLALSATLRPPDAVAAFVGGRALSYRGEEAVYTPRRVSIVSPPAEKRIELSVEFPAAPVPDSPGAPAGGFIAEAEDSRYAAVIPFMLARIRANRSTIVFCDSRRRAERIAFLLNEAGGEGTAWAHHGSLSREARRVVEERMRAGELACVVATASLELGIDIGGVDEVILAGAPPAVSSALQRVGRSGHGVGETSRGLILPFYGMDLLLSAAASRAVDERAVEESRPLSCPLDILAQVLLSLSAEGPRRSDALYDIVRSFPPFETLPRGLFDSTLEMLAGRYSSARLRELESRVALDRASGVVTAGDGVRTLLYSSGGAIPDRGMYSLRVRGSRTRIGELDEEFVWERKVGDAFSFGAQAWRIVEIGSEAVEVLPLGREADFMPFWKAGSRFRSPELAERSLALLDSLAPLGPEASASLLEAEYHFAPEAARALVIFIGLQKAAGGSSPSLPGSRRIAIEANSDPARRGDATRLVIHTLRGAAINETLALALAGAWEEEAGLPIQVIADDDSILALIPMLGGEGEAAATAARLLAALAAPGRLEALVRSRLEGTGLFGAQFRENAGRAILLPRGLPGKRTPLWITRLRAKKLFEAVRGFEDFPVTVETWRSCLGELLDLEGTRALVSAIALGDIEIGSFSTRSPSPFSREAIWKETNEFLYRGDALEARAASSVSDRVVAEALRSSRLRPRLDPELVADFVRRLKRLVPGWGPEDGFELA
ncbi:MAG TPA: helicase-related protein, partial [Rectinemataceae bacterium]|nr:helicase-related protein [Rectinemataceae bacterium]